jgi:hypothetical protein
LQHAGGGQQCRRYAEQDSQRGGAQCAQTACGGGADCTGQWDAQDGQRYQSGWYAPIVGQQWEILLQCVDSAYQGDRENCSPYDRLSCCLSDAGS